MLLLLFLGEVTLRFLTAKPAEEIRYKNIHCLKGFSEIRLCPDVDEVFTRADGKSWDILTNSTGERILSKTQFLNSPTKVWLIGDSMSMGYGLPTKETIAFVLENKFKLKVRVLAVDAIGTNGILSLYLHSYENTKQEDLPTHVYWIWNPSDFIDDEREKTGFKKIIYPLHFYLTRNLLLYQYLIPSPKSNVYTNGVPYLYPNSHITYTNLNQFFTKGMQNKERLTVLFSWGMAPNGLPDTNDPNYDRANEFFQKHGIRNLDLRKKTEDQFAKGKKIYIPNDGHPDRDLAEIFAEAISDDYQKHK